MLKNIALKGLQIASLKGRSVKRILEDHLLYTDFIFGNENVYLKCNSDLLLVSPTALSRFADEKEVEETQYAYIADTFPVAETVDLDRSNIYHKENDIGSGSGSGSLNHHTLLLSMNTDWSMEQRHASALLQSYGHCIQTARTRGISHLASSPVCVQAIHTDGEAFGFTCFQLNTTETDYKKESGVRNLAWVHGDRLYCKQIPRRSMLRNTQYHSYNGDVVHRIMGMLSRQ